MEGAFRASQFGSSYCEQMAVLVLNLASSYLACGVPHWRADARQAEPRGVAAACASLRPWLCVTVVLLALRWGAAQLTDQERAQRYSSHCTSAVW